MSVPVRFRVSPIPVREGSCHYNWLSTFSPGLVLKGPTGATFFPLQFFNHTFGNSFVSFPPVSVLILEIMTASFCSCCPGDFHCKVLSFQGLLSFFVSNFVLNPFSDPCHLRLQAGLFTEAMYFDHFPHLRSSSSCLRTSRKVSIQ